MGVREEGDLYFISMVTEYVKTNLGNVTGEYMTLPALSEKDWIYQSTRGSGSYVTADSVILGATDEPEDQVIDQIPVEEMVMPLCVVDKRDAVAENPDYVLTVEGILEWEKTWGQIPAGAFVIFQSGWSKRPAAEMDNLDAEGNRHFPGWQLETLKFLVEQRNIGGVGHETSDTEAPITSGKTNYEVEYYILSQNKMHLELLTNVDRCPPVGGLVFCTFPAVSGGTGFPARCFALCPKE